MENNLPTINDLLNSLSILNKEYPRPKLPPMELSKKLDLQTQYNALSDQYSGKVGVYILVNKDDDIIRIGSAIDDLYQRLNKYFDYRDDKEVAGIGTWKEGVSARYITVIETPASHRFEALAIEQYLLDKLTPPLNKEGKNKYSWYREKMREELNRLAVNYNWNQVSEKWYLP